MTFFICLALAARSLGDFETDADPGKWTGASCQLSAVEEHASSGRKALKAVFKDGASYPGLHAAEGILGDWSGFEHFEFDVHNAGGSTVRLSIRVDDGQSTGEYATQHNSTRSLVPGSNRVKVHLPTLKTISKRPVDLKTIKSVLLFMSKPKEDVTLYFDNFRLTRPAARVELEGFRGFDMGTDDSPLWAGFDRVTSETIYSPERGYGWLARGARSRHRERPDSLSCDYVRGGYGSAGKGPMSFRVDVPDAEHEVWVLTGTLSHYAFLQDRSYVLKCSGREVARVSSPGRDRSSFSYEGLDYRKGFSLWDTFIAPRFHEHRFGARPVDRAIVLEFSPSEGAEVAAVCVWPVSAKAGANAFLAQLNHLRREELTTWWKRVEHVEKGAAYQPTAEDTARGAVLFARSYMEDVYPNSLPRPGEVGQALEVFACPGEYEPVQFCIRPLRDLKDVRLQVSALSGGAGTIPPAAARVGRVQYHALSGGGLAHSPGKTWSVRPWYLVPAKEEDLEEGITRAYWLTVEVPRDFRGGEYRSTVALLSEGRTLAEVPLTLHVYPFELKTPPDVIYAHIYGVPAKEEWIHEDLVNFREHGMNSATISGTPRSPKRVGGKLAVDFSGADMFMRVAKKVGLTGPVPLFSMSIQGNTGHNSYSHMRFERVFKYPLKSDEYVRDFEELVRLVDEHAKANDWLPVLMYPSTEISNDTDLGWEFNNRLADAAHRVPGVKIISSINRPSDLNSLPKLDYVMYNDGVRISEETVRKAHEAGCVLWFQNIGGNRFSEGFYMWKCGAMGRRQFMVNCLYGDPFNEFDGPEKDSQSFLYPSKHGPVPTLNWERMREGVDDYRYLYTLDALAKESKDEKLAPEARAAIDEIMSRTPIKLSERDVAMRAAWDGWAVTRGYDRSTTFDAFRRELAKMAERLAAGAPVETAEAKPVPAEERPAPTPGEKRNRPAQRPAPGKTPAILIGILVVGLIIVTVGILMRRRSR